MIVSTNESRPFLKKLGIEGEIIRTVSHSADSVSLILDDGNCFVGDLELYYLTFIKYFANIEPVGGAWH